MKISNALSAELKRLDDCAKNTEKLERWPNANIKLTYLLYKKNLKVIT